MIHTEPLIGGLVTSREPSVLSDGELTLCTNGIFRPFSDYLDQLKDRSQFSSFTPAAGIYTRLEGFEGGGGSGSSIGPIFQGISGTGFSIQGTTVRTGNRALKVNPAGATGDNVELTLGWTGAAGPWGNGEAVNCTYLRFYLNIGAMPATSSNIFTLLGGFPIVARLYIYLNSDGTLKLDPDATGASATNGTTVLSLGTWYQIELKYDDLPQQVLYINNAVEITKNVTHPGSVYHLAFGQKTAAGASAYTIYADDLAIQASNTKEELSLPGYGRIKRLELDGDGTVDGFWSSTETTAYEALDETDIDTTTYISYSGTNAAAQTLTIESLASANVPNVKALQQSFCGYNVSSGPNIKLIQKLGATQVDLTSGFNISVSSSYTMYAWCSSDPPSEFGSATWTGGLVDIMSNLEVGVARLAAAAIQTRITQVVTQVEYDDGALPDIWGMKATPFEQDFTDGTIVLVASSDTEWYYNDNGGPWVSFRTGVTADKRIEVVHFNDAYFVANGVDTQKVFRNDYTTIDHGMVTLEHSSTVIPITVSLDSGTWSEVAGDYGYWITEYDSTNDLEGAAIFAGTFGSYIPGGTISDPATECLKITINYDSGGYPTKLNTNADFWRVYRVQMTSSDIEVPFPRGGIRIPTYSAGSGGTRYTQVAIPGSGPVVIYDQGDTLGIPYDYVEISVAGSPSAGFSINEEPPIFSTGDVFEDSLVLNDVNDDSIIRYSFQGRPHYFPAPYYIGFETKQADTVTFIRTIGGMLIVGLNGQIWRVNYLPNETDSTFERGRVKELLSANGGIPGPDCGTIFTLEDGAPLLAYVSYDGLYMTDGRRISPLTHDLDWPATVAAAQLDKAILINNQALQCLFLYYIENGSQATEPDKLVILSYHPLHLKEGFLKVCGIATFTTRAADYAYSTRKSYACDETLVYEEDEGNPLTLTASTRIIYPDNVDKEWHVQRTWTLFQSATHTAATIALKRRHANAADVTDTAVAIGTAASLVKAEQHGRAEGFGATISSDEALRYVSFEFTGTQGK